MNVFMYEFDCGNIVRLSVFEIKTLEDLCEIYLINKEYEGKAANEVRFKLVDGEDESLLTLFSFAKKHFNYLDNNIENELNFEEIINSIKQNDERLVEINLDSFYYEPLNEFQRKELLAYLNLHYNNNFSQLVMKFIKEEYFILISPNFITGVLYEMKYDIDKKNKSKIKNWELLHDKLIYKEEYQKSLSITKMEDFLLLKDYTLEMQKSIHVQIHQWIESYKAKNL